MVIKTLQKVEETDSADQSGELYWGNNAGSYDPTI